MLKNCVLRLAIQASVAQVVFCSNRDPKFCSGEVIALGILIPKA